MAKARVRGIALVILLGLVFSARILFYGDRYAGTWQHDQVSGHMFGRIKKQ